MSPVGGGLEGEGGSGHSPDCDEVAAAHHAATGGDCECICEGGRLRGNDDVTVRTRPAVEFPTTAEEWITDETAAEARRLWDKNRMASQIECALIAATDAIRPLVAAVAERSEGSPSAPSFEGEREEGGASRNDDGVRRFDEDDAVRGADDPGLDCNGIGGPGEEPGEARRNVSPAAKSAVSGSGEWPVCACCGVDQSMARIAGGDAYCWSCLTALVERNRKLMAPVVAGAERTAPPNEDSGEREGPREIFDRLAESLGGQEKLIDWLLVEVKPLLDAHDSGEREGATPDDELVNIAAAALAKWDYEHLTTRSNPGVNVGDREAAKAIIAAVAEAKPKARLKPAPRNTVELPDLDTLLGPEGGQPAVGNNDYLWTRKSAAMFSACLAQLDALREASATTVRYLVGVEDGLREGTHTPEVAANIVKQQVRNLRRAIKKSGPMSKDKRYALKTMSYPVPGVDAPPLPPQEAPSPVLYDELREAVVTQLEKLRPDRKLRKSGAYWDGYDDALDDAIDVAEGNPTVGQVVALSERERPCSPAPTSDGSASIRNYRRLDNQADG